MNIDHIDKKIIVFKVYKNVFWYLVKKRHQTLILLEEIFAQPSLMLVHHHKEDLVR